MPALIDVRIRNWQDFARNYSIQYNTIQ